MYLEFFRNYKFNRGDYFLHRQLRAIGKILSKQLFFGFQLSCILRNEIYRNMFGMQSQSGTE